MLFRGTTTHVEEVGRLTTVVLDNVHGRHCQTSAIDETGYVAIEADVVEIVFGSGHFTWVFLFFVTHRNDVGVTIKRVVIETELGIER